MVQLPTIFTVLVRGRHDRDTAGIVRGFALWSSSAVAWPDIQTVGIGEVGITTWAVASDAPHVTGHSSSAAIDDIRSRPAVTWWSMPTSGGLSALRRRPAKEVLPGDR